MKNFLKVYTNYISTPKILYIYGKACPLVVKTFKSSTAERVPSECSQLRYTSDILEYLFKSTAERVPSECS